MESNQVSVSNEDDRFLKILESTQIGLIVLSPQGVAHYMNPAAKALLQYLPEEIFNDAYDWKSQVGKLLEFEHPNPGAEPFRIDVKPMEMTWDGKPVFLLNVEDVSSKRRVEKLLRMELDEAEIRTSELEVMRFVSEQLNRSALLDETIQVGLAAVQQITNASAAWVVLPEEGAPPRLVLVDRFFQDGKVDKSLLKAPETCSCLERLQQGRLSGAMLVQPCEWMANVFPEIPAEDGHMTVPLKTTNGVIGLLNLVVPNSRRLNHGELRLLETVGGQMAYAIERARDLSKELASFSRDQSLNLVTNTINSALDLPTVLVNILRLAVEMAGADAGVLGILSADGESLSFPFLYKVPEEFNQQQFLRGNGMFWEVISNSRPVLMDGYHGLSDGLPENFAQKLMCAMVAPISNGEKPLGVISLFSMEHKKKFNTFDLTLVESLGRQAGMAIQNAQLYFEVQMLTTTDPLTGFHNQVSFNNLGIKEVERSFRYDRPLGIIVVDVDHMALYNKQYGSTTGDEALKVVGQNCGSSLRKVDIISRYSGDEFVLLLPETNLANTHEVAERLRLRVEGATVIDGINARHVTVSIGVASQENREELDLESLLVRAEEALTDAKQAGGNRVCVWSPDI